MNNSVNEMEAVEQRAQEKLERKAQLKEWLFVKKREFRKNCNIVKQLVIRSVKVQYRNSVIGIFWTILNPLLNMLVMYLVFSNMFKRGGGTTPVDAETYALYLLCGNIVFGMMRTATYQSLTCIVNNRGLLTKNKMSYNVFPLACNVSAVVNFLFSFVALLGVMLVVWLQGQSVFSLNIFLVVVALPALFLFSYGLSLVLAAMYTFFRDISHFYNVFLTLWMYMTPIFYNISMFSSTGFSDQFMSTVINMNPMYHFVEYFRDVTYRCAAHRGAVDKLEAAGEFVSELMRQSAELPGFGNVCVLYLIGGISVLVGTLVFMLTKRRFIYNI